MGNVANRMKNRIEKFVKQFPSPGDEGWRLDLASRATIEPNSEAADNGESLWARSPYEVVQGA